MFEDKSTFIYPKRGATQLRETILKGSGVESRGSRVVGCGGYGEKNPKVVEKI